LADVDRIIAHSGSSVIRTRLGLSGDSQ
jgi:hypothetical protein